MRSRVCFCSLGSVALGIGGWAHLCLYRHGYRAIAVIGPMFAANVVVSLMVAALLVVQRGRLVRVAGLTIAAGTLVAFAASRLPTGLFGFQERGFDPAPQAAIAFVAELVAVVVLGLSLAPRSV